MNHTLATLRPSQRQVLEYESGPLGISAVPGSGKTYILELLVTDLIGRRQIAPERVAIFTYMRSARSNLIRRINQRLREQKVQAHFSNAFTLHALALKILKAFESRTASSSITILEQYEQDRLLSQLTRAWLRHHTRLWEPLLPEDESPLRNRNYRVRFNASFQSMCGAVIRTAKAYRLKPEDLTPDPHGYLSWAQDIYQSYQTELTRLGKFDYDDLGWQAIELLGRDRELLQEVQSWYDFLFEDEAQDSTPIQDELLSLISQSSGNLVRVGDPNQSIMGTFTTAEPHLFREFCAQQTEITLDESNRSAPKILTLANALVDWVNQQHPLPTLQQALALQHIQPATSGPANPSDTEANIQFHRIQGTPEDELKIVVQQAIAAVTQDPERSAVILVATNEQGATVLNQLQTSGFEQAIDLLRSNPTQKRVLQGLYVVVHYLGQPSSSNRLVSVIETLSDWAEIPRGSDWKTIRDWIQESLPEDLIFPAFKSFSLDPDTLGIAPSYWHPLQHLLQTLAHWLEASRSPWPDVLNLIAQELYRSPEDLFICHYVIEHLEQALGDQSSLNWEDISSELQVILSSRLNNLPSEIMSFTANPGTITVTTVHRSKGLEWDQVFLTGLSAYDYPVTFNEHPIGLAFLDGADLQAEALAELRHQVGRRATSAGTATEQAFLDLAAERLRLLYVGLTRAKRFLNLSVASQDPFERDQKPSALFHHLYTVATSYNFASDPLIQPGSG